MILNVKNLQRGKELKRGGRKMTVDINLRERIMMIEVVAGIGMKENIQKMKNIDQEPREEIRNGRNMEQTAVVRTGPREGRENSQEIEATLADMKVMSVHLTEMKIKTSSRVTENTKVQINILDHTDMNGESLQEAPRVRNSMIAAIEDQEVPENRNQVIGKTMFMVESIGGAVRGKIEVEVILRIMRERNQQRVIKLSQDVIRDLDHLVYQDLMTLCPHNMNWFDPSPREITGHCLMITQSIPTFSTLLQIRNTGEINKNSIRI